MEYSFSLDDVGRIVSTEIMDYGGKRVRRGVAMVITAPRGRLTLFAEGGNVYTQQAEVIKAFMEQHRE